MKSISYNVFFYFTMLILSISLFISQGCKEEPCAGITCLNGGICATGICICPEGYQGENCGVATGEACGSEICLNGGVCVNNTCQCPVGWGGVNCSIEVPNPCANITCLNGGVCVNGVCNCPPGFSGQFCEIAGPGGGDPCDNVVCQNGGTCVNGACDCPAGFSGPNCGIAASGHAGLYSGTIECSPVPAGTPTTMHDITIEVTQNGSNLDLTFSGLFNTTVEATPDLLIPNSYMFTDGSFGGTVGFFLPDELSLSIADGVSPDQQSCLGTLTR